jgi:SAM-dependent methyltransferase
MQPWHEAFFEGLYGRVLGGQFDQETSREQARLVRRLLGVRRGAKVLDIPCGQGRLTVPLAAMGLEMTGLDRTAAFLRKARRLARREGVSARFVCGDMRSITFDGEFDAALNWFSSWGYFSDAENAAVLERIRSALRPGGRFLIDTLNKSWLVTNFRPVFHHRFGGVAVEIHNRWHPEVDRMISEWTFRRGRTVEHHRVNVRLLNGAEMRQALRQAGFRDITLYGGPPPGPLTRHARRLMAVARRPRA